MKVEQVTPDDVELLSGVYGGCEQSPRRVLRELGPGVLDEILKREVSSSINHPVALKCRVRSSTAFVAVAEDPWASKSLGVGLGRIGPVFAGGKADDRSQAVTAAISASLEASAGRGLSLLTMRVHADDEHIISACLSNGFVRAGEENVYLRTSTSNRSAPYLRNGSIEIETIMGGHPIVIGEADRAQLLERAGRFRLSHLGSNSSLPIEATENFYRSWTENVIDGSYGDVVAVARLDGQVVGFFAWKSDTEIARHHGVDLLNGSWAVVSAQRQGVLQALSEAVVERPTDGVGWIECETQVQNTAMNIVMNRIGTGPPPQRCVVLHRWT
ncbi:MAG: hypothetical protein WBF71_10725 [Microthrixaceae bacterium]